MENIIGYTSLIMAIAVIGQLISIRSQWTKLETRSKVILRIGLPLQVISIVTLLLLSWGVFPWGRASAFKAADRFMSALQHGDSVEAGQYMRRCVRDFIGVDGLGNSDDTRPVSWQWTDYTSRASGSLVSTIGTAIFLDGAEVPIELKWDWNGYKWELYGATFGEYEKDHRLDFSWGC